MSSQSITPASNHGSFALFVSSIAGIAGALSSLSWLIALPVWLAGTAIFLSSHWPRSQWERAGLLLAICGTPLTAFIVYRCLTPIA